jgi:hypothetical protein
MAKQTYTLGQVASAIQIPRPTLLSWTQRGYLPFLNDRAEGEPREFDQNDVAYTAAFAVLARCGGGDAMGAAQMMQDVFKDQRSYWHKAIKASKEDKSVYILAKRYTYKGAAQIEADLHVGDGLQTHLSVFEDPTASGDRVGSERESSSPTDQFTFAVPVGKAIAAALKTLP